ncbi:hypothetical protein AVEN_215105-1 [Araneus ventricosus]|uniref:Uncharacterized protein n=1 Tax=Araneus ventricosus TaxID=182803 RepID=A0A4Y2TJ60_ARAVE|nr:hypothetical protein AVEN_215105-1 [Araneus ventricosus]
MVSPSVMISPFKPGVFRENSTLVVIRRGGSKHELDSPTGVVLTPPYSPPSEIHRLRPPVLTEEMFRPCPARCERVKSEYR